MPNFWPLKCAICDNVLNLNVDRHGRVICSSHVYDAGWSFVKDELSDIAPGEEGYEICENETSILDTND